MAVRMSPTTSICVTPGLPQSPATGACAGTLPSPTGGVSQSATFHLEPADAEQRTIFTLDTDLGRSDLLAEVAGLGDWNEIGNCCILLPAFDREVWTLNLPSLIRAKRAAGRPKDLLVLPELESLLEAANEG